jgi:AhpD family alkylhydroperoxidase
MSINTSTPAPDPSTRTPAPVTIPAAGFSAGTRSSRARIPLDPPTGLIGRVLNLYSRRRYGQVMDNLLALGHNRRVLFTDARFELSLARWNRLDPQLKALAVMATAARIECSWCLDFGYYEAHSHGLDTDKIAAVSSWRTSTDFTELERNVLEYAEAMTATPPTVTDELAESLRIELGNDGLVELTMMIAVENQRSRVNAALGLSSQGFSESCRVPETKR